MVELAKRERQLQPRLGARKLMHLLEDDLKEAQVRIGRDRFFEVLARNDLWVVPKRGRARTTNSRHSLPVAPGFPKRPICQ
jgi:putative transposase